MIRLVSNFLKEWDTEEQGITVIVLDQTALRAVRSGTSEVEHIAA